MLHFFGDPLQRLQSLVAADAMTCDIAVISDSSTMDEAARLLEQAAASGAPVVDVHGCCVGVLSAKDFVRFEIDRAGEGDCSHVWRDALNGDYLPWNSVQRYMSKPLLAVRPTTSLLEAAQLMCSEHIHRLLVLGENSTLQGIISTLDVIAAVLAATEERRQCSTSKDD